MSKTKLFIILLVGVVCAVLFSAGCVSNDTTNTSNSADMVIYGPIYTVDSNNTVAEALAVKDGIITYVGNEAGVKKYIGDKTEILKGNFVLPGFISAHEHGNYTWYPDPTQVDLSKATSYQECLDLVAQHVKNNPNVDVIRGNGWKKEYVVGEKKSNYPNFASDLDAITKDKIILLSADDGHLCWVNSKALNEMGYNKDTPDPAGGKLYRDDAGNLNGIIVDRPMYDIMDKFPVSLDIVKKSIIGFQNYLLSNGVTAHADAVVNVEGTDVNAALIELDKEGKLMGKVYGYILLKQGETNVDPTIEKIVSLKKETEGHGYEVKALKLFVDGGTPYMYREYLIKPGYYGQLSYLEDTIYEAVEKAKKNGLSVHFHSLGDKTFHICVDALEKAYDKYGITDGRDSIAHIFYAQDEDIKTAGKLGVTASLNPYWFGLKIDEINSVDLPIFGQEYLDKKYPAKSLADAGCELAAGADFPVTSYVNPLIAIQAGIVRTADTENNIPTNPTEALSLEQMIRAVTYGGAYQNGDEMNRGSLEVGKVADIVILNKDLRKMDPSKIGTDARVEKTILGGKVVYVAEDPSDISSIIDDYSSSSRLLSLFEDSTNNS